MKVKIDDQMKKQIIVLSVSLIIAISVGLLINNFNVVIKGVKIFVGAAKAFLLGLLFAFVLRRPVYYVETKVFKNKKHARLFAGLIVFVLFICLLIFLGIMIVPNLIDSLQTLIGNYSNYQKQITIYSDSLSKITGTKIPSFENLVSDEEFSAQISTYVAQLADYSIAFIKGILNFIIALVSAFYMILDKEQLKKAVKKLNYSLFSISIADEISQLCRNAINIFDKFIVGSIIDSSIIGLICFIGVTIMHLPYNVMIAVFVGVTNIIPVFGPFIGAIPVLILLLLINPWYSLFFLIFIFALQQFDGNILKPIVLGDQLGLSGFWILFSVTVGGSLGGIVGMFLGVPIFALVYKTLGSIADIRLKKKNLDINDEVTD